MPTISSDAATTARRSWASEPKPWAIQVPRMHAAQHEAGEHERAAEQQAVLEPEARAHAVEPGVLLAHEVGAVGVRAEPEREHLRADDHQQRAADQRVHAPGAPEEVEAARPTSTTISVPSAGEQRRRGR